MKKIIFVMVLLVCFISSAVADDPQSRESSEKAVTKSYELKHISPDDAEDVLKPFFFRFAYSRSSNMIVVTLPQENVAAFEEMLKKIDAERPMLHFRIFTVIASNKAEGKPIENAQLRSVLDELKKLLSFKSYYLDGVSLISCKEGSRDSSVQLSSSFPNLSLDLERPIIEGNAQSGRTVKFQIDLRQTHRLSTEKFNTTTLIRADSIAIKENGYLVAGVSKIGENGDSLILVINMQIK